MKNNEFITNFKLLSGYQPNKTLTENIESILVVEGMAETAMSVAQTFKDILSSEKGLFSQFKNDIPAFSRFKNADELLKALETVGKDGSLLKNHEVIGIAKDLAKTSPEIAVKLKGMIGKSDAFLDIAKKVFPNGAVMGAESKSLKIAQDYYKQFGIEAKEVEQMLKDSLQKGRDIKIKPKISIKATEEIIAASGKSEKEIKQLIKQDSFFAKKKKYFTDLYSRLKSGGISKETLQRWKQRGFLNKNGKISWKKVALWAVAIGISYNVLKDMLNKGGVFIDDTDTGGTNTGGTNTGGTNTGGSGNGTGGSTFKECTDFPYTKGCSSSVVSEVQKCLGIGADGKFGSKTQQALTAGGYGTEITKEVYDKIKEKCGTGGTTTTTTVPAPEFQQLDVRANEITW
jgi:hypothetical protein